ncbi:hypothetical protein [Pedobacter sp.]|uniref:hypothetical protein n=1 Tax=Pedobacter sp. TaxID=1411316 RepID=UPI003BAABF88
MVYTKPDHQLESITVLNSLVANIDDAIAILSEKVSTFEQSDQEHFKTDKKGISPGNPWPSITWFKDPPRDILYAGNGRLIPPHFS